jgi:ATP-dependent Clp protease ATP-binding subunit ClpX
MEMDGIELVFEDDALEYVVDKALEYKLGARGLRSIVESVMMDKMYEMPSMTEKSCRITKEYASMQFAKCDPAGFQD